MDIPLLLIGLDLLIAMAVYMTLWYAMSVYVKRTDIIDAAWGLGFIYVTALVLILDGRNELWQWVILGFVSVWGLRLFIHVASRLGRTQEDKRYKEYRAKWGEKFQSKAYTDIFLLQGLLLIVVSSPALAAVMSPRDPLLWLMITGFVVWGVGIAYETIADYQLQRFIIKKTGRLPNDIMDRGLWKYSRHPNYFGEIVAWWGAGIVALSMGQWWGLIGSIAITYLIVKVSGIPPLEKRYQDVPAYQEYKKKTPVLIPSSPSS
jgi:steroid 5-alpha reductase family enzyme